VSKKKIEISSLKIYPTMPR